MWWHPRSAGIQSFKINLKVVVGNGGTMVINKIAYLSALLKERLEGSSLSLPLSEWRTLSHCGSVERIQTSRR